MMQKKVLYILKHNPWGIGGGAYVSLMYLTAFCKLFQGYQIDVLINDSCLENQPIEWKNKCNFISVHSRSILSRFFSVFTGIMHRYQSIAKQKLRNNNYEYCIFDHNQIAGTLINYLSPSTKSIVIHHNVEQNYFADNSTSKLFKLLMLPHVIRCEKKAFKECDYNIFLTAEDMSEFRSLYGNTKKKCAVIGIFDLKDKIFVHDGNTSKTPAVVISGTLGNVQNIDGINYFINELYSYIPKEIPIIIAGKNPQSEIIKSLEGLSNVKLVANPKDMNKIINLANIYICPTRLGSGIKVRISDALKNGLPVIAHKVSARGYGEYIKKGYFFSFSTPIEFKDAFDFVLRKQKNGEWNSEDIKKEYNTISSLSAGYQRLKDYIL